MDNETKIDLPAADELDSGAWSEASGWTCRLYLIPAEESETGRPAVALHSGLGNIGWPGRAHCRRWLSLGSYGPKVVGQSVRDLLESLEGELVALSELYEGTEFDGSNHVGRWGEGYGELQESVGQLWDDGRQGLQSYWDAWDYYSPAGTGWAELCDDAGVDPERVLGADWEAVVEEVARGAEAATGEYVSGVAGYAREKAEAYRSGREVA